MRQCPGIVLLSWNVTSAALHLIVIVQHVPLPPLNQFKGVRPLLFCGSLERNCFLLVDHKYYSLFWYGYMLRSFSSIIGLPIQYCKVRLKMHDTYIYIQIYIYIVYCILYTYIYIYISWGGLVVKALRYQSEGPGIDPRSRDFFRGIRQFHVPWGRLSL